MKTCWTDLCVNSMMDHKFSKWSDPIFDENDKMWESKRECLHDCGTYNVETRKTLEEFKGCN